MQNIPIPMIKCLLGISDSYLEVLFRLKLSNYEISMNYDDRYLLIRFINDNKIAHNKLKYETPQYLSLLWGIPKFIFGEIVRENTSISGIIRDLENKYHISTNHSIVSKRIDIDQIYNFHFTKCNTINDISDENFIKIVNESKSYTEINKKLGKNHGRNRSVKTRIKKLDISISHFEQKYTDRKRAPIPLENILIENSNYSSCDLKKRLIKENMLENKCVDCGNTGEWNGKPITLQLDHINGNHYDNRIENLTIRCPNCHSQTDNYGSKNKTYQKSGFRDLDKLHKLEPKKEYKCCDCNVEICKGAHRCDPCYKKSIRKVERPSYEQLKKDLNEMSCIATAKKYGVSNVAICKWIKNYEKENLIKNT